MTSRTLVKYSLVFMTCLVCGVHRCANAVPLDFDGDGLSDVVAHYDQADGSRNELVYNVLRSADGQISSSEFGKSGDLPVPADYDGDGISDLAVVHPENDLLYWNIRPSGDSDSIISQQFGVVGDLALGGCDFDGDSLADRAVVRGTDLLFQRSSDAAEMSVTIADSVLSRVYCSDIDVDGVDEIIGQTKAELGVARVVRVSGEVILSQTLAGDVADILAADVDGDGFPEIGSVQSNRSVAKRIVFYPGGSSYAVSFPGFLTAVVGRFDSGNSGTDGLVVKATKAIVYRRYKSVAQSSSEKLIIRDSDSLLGAVNSGLVGILGVEQCDVNYPARDGAGTGFLWKPVSDTTRAAVLLLPAGIRVTKASLVKDGKVIEQLYDRGIGNGNRQHWGSRRRAGTFPTAITVVAEKRGLKQCWLIDSPLKRID